MKQFENKIACILAHGKSVSELENKIYLFKNKDVIWSSLSVFPIMEEFILNKINKHLDIVFDCATVPNSFRPYYESIIRLPRIEKFLERNENNLWVTTKGIIRDSIPFKPLILEKYKKKIFIIDNLFPHKTISDYMSVPNSICLLIAFLLFSKVSKIILFGFDGFARNENNINSYYKPEYHKKEQLVSIGKVGRTDLFRDTYLFNKKFPLLLKRYRYLFRNNCKIVNCSPNSAINVIAKINYEELEKEL